MCHFTVHAGRAEHLGKTDLILEHYCLVNNVSKKRAKKDLKKAWYIFYARNNYKYKLKITEKKAWNKINKFLLITINFIEKKILEYTSTSLVNHIIKTHLKNKLISTTPSTPGTLPLSVYCHIEMSYGK